MIIVIIMLAINAIILVLPNEEPEWKCAGCAAIDLLFMVFVWAAAISGVIK